MLANCVRGYKNKHEWSDIPGRASSRTLKGFLLKEGFWQISESNELDSQDKWTKKKLLVGSSQLLFTGNILNYMYRIL